MRRAGARLVVLDPGHGGVDPGCIGCTGIYEKDMALQLGLELARELEETGHYHVTLTRSSDEFVPLEDRVARARAANAELFLSIHADALPDEWMRGASVFTLSGKGLRQGSGRAGRRENRADLVAGVDFRATPRK